MLVLVLVFVLQCWCSLVTNPPSAIISIFQSLGLNDRIYLSFSNIVLGSKPVIVVLDEEDVDEDGGVDEEGEGDDEEEGPLYPHLRSRLHERRPLKTNLGRKVSQALTTPNELGKIQTHQVTHNVMK